MRALWLHGQVMHAWGSQEIYFGFKFENEFHLILDYASNNFLSSFFSSKSLFVDLSKRNFCWIILFLTFGILSILVPFPPFFGGWELALESIHKKKSKAS